MLLVVTGYRLGPNRVAKLGTGLTSNKDTRRARVGIVSPCGLVVYNLPY